MSSSEGYVAISCCPKRVAVCPTVESVCPIRVSYFVLFGYVMLVISPYRQVSSCLWSSAWHICSGIVSAPEQFGQATEFELYLDPKVAEFGHKQLGLSSPVGGVSWGLLNSCGLAGTERERGLGFKVSRV